MADSTIKVFWLDKGSLSRSLGIGENNPFAEQDPTQVLNTPYTITSSVGLRMQLFADQYENAGLSGQAAAPGNAKKISMQAKQNSTTSLKNMPPIV